MLDHVVSLPKAFSWPRPSVEKHPLETWVSWPSFTFQSHVYTFFLAHSAPATRVSFLTTRI